MKKSGKRLGRRELKRRIRAIVLSSVMTVTMAFSNMAGLYPAVVHADDITFLTYFKIESGYYVPNFGEGINEIALANDITKPSTGNHCQSTNNKTINLAGHTMDITPGGWSTFYVNSSKLTINGSGRIEGQLFVKKEASTAAGSVEINGGSIKSISIGNNCSVTLNSGHIDELTLYIDSDFEHVNGTIGEIDNGNSSNYSVVSFASGGGTGNMGKTAGKKDGYTLPACKFTAPANKEFAGWSVGSEVKQAGQTVTLTGDITITATWKDAPASQPQQIPVTTSGSSSSSYSSYDDDDDDYEAPAATDTNAALVNANGTVATPDIALPTYTGRYQPTLTNNTGENPRAGLLTASGQAVFTFKTTSGEDDSFDHFQGAQMDGVTLSSWEYDVTRGSTIITLTKDVINSLDDGAHTLTMIFDDEVVTVPFTKAGLSKSSPKMGED